MMTADIISEKNGELKKAQCEFRALRATEVLKDKAMEQVLKTNILNSYFEKSKLFKDLGNVLRTQNKYPNFFNFIIKIRKL